VIIGAKRRGPYILCVHAHVRKRIWLGEEMTRYALVSDVHPSQTASQTRAHLMEGFLAPVLLTVQQNALSVSSLEVIRMPDYAYVSLWGEPHAGAPTSAEECARLLQDAINEAFP